MRDTSNCSFLVAVLDAECPCCGQSSLLVKTLEDLTTRINTSHGTYALSHVLLINTLGKEITYLKSRVSHFSLQKQQNIITSIESKQETLNKIQEWTNKQHLVFKVCLSYDDLETLKLIEESIDDHKLFKLEVRYD